MPLPIQKRKVASIEYIIKKLKGSDSYDNMKRHNEEGSNEKMYVRTEPESDYKTGMKMAVSEMMTAVESKDAEAFERWWEKFNIFPLLFSSIRW